MSEAVLSDFGVGILIFALFLGILSRGFLAKLLSVPYTVLLLVLGLAIGAMNELTPYLGENLGKSIEGWLNVNPEVIFFTFLPILLFASSYKTSFHIFQKELLQVILLATVGVAISTGLTAVFLFYVLPYDWDWFISLLVGSMLAATDPVSVVSLLEEAGVSEKLSTLIEGESMLNDGTAIVFFNVFLAAAVGELESIETAIGTFFRLSLGGPAIGVTYGTAASFLLGYIINDSFVETTVTIVAAYSAFLTAEATPLRVSGVLAVVLCGVIMSNYGRPRVSASSKIVVDDFWSIASYIANTMIFVIAGILAAEKAFLEETESIRGIDWLYLVYLFAAINAIRYTMIAFLLPVFMKSKYSLGWREVIVLGYSGLRGAVSLTLALIIDQEEEIDRVTRSRIVFFVAGIAMLTLLVNGTFTESLLSLLGLDRVAPGEREYFGKVELLINRRLADDINAIKEDTFFADASFLTAWRYIPVVSPEVYWDRICMLRISLSNTEIDTITSSGGAQSILAFLRRYKDVPSRLRRRWYTYHRTYSRQMMTGEAAEIAIDNHLKNLAIPPEHYARLEIMGKIKLTQDRASKDLSGLSPPTSYRSDDASLSSFVHRSEVDNSFDDKLTVFDPAQVVSYLDDNGIEIDLNVKVRIAREHFLQAIRAVYGRFNEDGRIRPSAFILLQESVEADLDESDEALASWDLIYANVSKDLSAFFSCLRTLPLLGRIVDDGVHDRIAFGFELGASFIEAHQRVDIRDLWESDDDVLERLTREKNEQIRMAESFIRKLMAAYPEIIASFKATATTRYLLKRYRTYVTDMLNGGYIQQRQYNALIEETNESEAVLDAHPRILNVTPIKLLGKIPFLRNVDEVDIEDMIADDVIVLNEIYDLPIVFFQQGLRGVQQGKFRGSSGWYYIVRGIVNVRLGDDLIQSMGSGAIFGLVDSVLDTESQATFESSQYVKLIFFKTDAILDRCLTNEELFRGIWSTVSASMLCNRVDDLFGNTIENFLETLSSSDIIYFDGEEATVNGSVYDEYASTTDVDISILRNGLTFETPEASSHGRVERIENPKRGDKLAYVSFPYDKEDILLLKGSTFEEENEKNRDIDYITATKLIRNREHPKSRLVMNPDTIIVLLNPGYMERLYERTYQQRARTTPLDRKEQLLLVNSGMATKANGQSKPRKGKNEELLLLHRLVLEVDRSSFHHPSLTDDQLYIF